MVRVDVTHLGNDRCVHSLATQHRDQCQDTASRFDLRQCQHTDWIGFVLDYSKGSPLALMGIMCAVGREWRPPAKRAKAPPLAPSTFEICEWAGQHTDWIGCRWLCCDSHQHLSAKRVVVVASGGNILLSSSESVSTRSIHNEPLDAGAEPQPMLGGSKG